MSNNLASNYGNIRYMLVVQDVLRGLTDLVISLFACGGVVLKNGWLYDGLYWERTSRPMNVGRDRPACSLMSDPGLATIQFFSVSFL